ncbi:hypothetical protein N7492_006553 [Penicillium capsulatum]|uniref:DUF2406 domain-containing protein n=1 Tax=Penicillium capsulatum TaxID=69766 RepID=A0A9W9LL91_9EURO|nr:hypothetical protein N7492_006553 [Penicillium capsulatum]KAJ6116388.1 hypothetical protein N7512_006113 [Penicillium capsulatum]
MAAPQPASSTRSRGFSVKSDKSHHSGTSGHKSHLSESSEEKARRSLHTKADPLIAMNELQPMAVALEKSNMGSLRDVQHKDQYGNVITDPDWSNPTRPRFERPLDTIRSFEAAIYGPYSSTRPGSYARTVDDAASQAGDYSRRTSYYGENPGQFRPGSIANDQDIGAHGQMNRGYSDYSTYYGRGNQSRPDSVVDYQGAGHPPDNAYPYNQNGSRRPRHYSRMSSDQSQGPYTPNTQYPPQQAHQRSYDMSGPGSTDAYGQPTELGSSIDQLQQQAMYQQRMDERAQADYGFPVPGKGPSPPAPVADPHIGGPVGGRTPTAAPATNSLLRKTQNGGNEKRKSWFKRRFSKD